MALEAAIDILETEGIAGLSTRKVAKAIGYTVGTLYHVFENFDDLVLHINARSLDELEDQIQKAVAQYDDASEQVHAIAEAYLAYASENYDRWTLMYSHKLAEENALPDWFNERVQQLFMLVSQPLQQLRTQSTERLQSGVRILWSLVHGACELALNNKMQFAGNVDAGTTLRDGVSNFLYGYINQQD